MHPISLLNIDYKNIWKALAARLKNVLPKFVSWKQIAYF